MDKEIHIKFENGSEIKSILCEGNVRSERNSEYLEQLQEQIYSNLGVSEELFKRDKAYQEAYKLWLLYNYQCELFDSKVCTSSNEYEDYMPRTYEESKLINRTALYRRRAIEHKREELREQGINISNDDWMNARSHFARYKLKALEEEYKHYFGED